MERIEVLINKLKEQFDQGAGLSQLQLTVQQLHTELARQPASAARTLGTSKVAVMLPSSNGSYDQYAPRPADDEEEEPAVKEVKETLLVEEGNVSVVQKNGQLDMVFDPMTEIPTLSHQVREKELNDMTAQGESLNDKLKQGKTELVEILKETPVKDLRKAIGINDRFLFINELFRGDEAMYERSIKTINSFNIFPEAEYWISRELKIKIGWSNDNPTVKHFDQLVRRRFS
ncbi:MAG TPA: hypothetical protein VFX58_09675 [Chitinophagaceae bacterium]|nr:hypothetical protein [Chitinophagaceae bacterium]